VGSNPTLGMAPKLLLKLIGKHINRICSRSAKDYLSIGELGRVPIIPYE